MTIHPPMFFNTDAFLVQLRIGNKKHPNKKQRQTDQYKQHKYNLWLSEQHDVLAWSLLFSFYAIFTTVLKLLRTHSC